jgi:plastocyanin
MVPTAHPRPALPRPARAPGRVLLPALALVFATAIVLNACSNDFEPDEARDVQTVRINPGAAVTTNRYPFSPSPHAVNRQTLINFFNADTTAHQLAHIGGTFAAETPVAPGDTWGHLFSEPGSYRYYCTRPNHREEGVIHVLQ